MRHGPNPLQPRRNRHVVRCYAGRPVFRRGPRRLAPRDRVLQALITPRWCAQRHLYDPSFTRIPLVLSEKRPTALV